MRWPSPVRRRSTCGTSNTVPVEEEETHRELRHVERRRTGEGHRILTRPALPDHIGIASAVQWASRAITSVSGHALKRRKDVLCTPILRLPHHVGYRKRAARRTDLDALRMGTQIRWRAAHRHRELSQGTGEWRSRQPTASLPAPEGPRSARRPAAPASLR